MAKARLILPLQMAVDNVLSNAEIFYEDPRAFRSYDEFLGFQIGRIIGGLGIAELDYKIESAEQLVKAVHEQLKAQNDADSGDG